LFLPAVILAGHWAKDQEGISWLVMPFVQILAASIPVLWLAWLGIRKLLHQSPQRTWGIFSSGLVLGPVIIFSLEIAVLLFFVIIAAIFLALNPEIVEALEPLILRMEYAKPDSTAEMEVLSQIYNNPVVIFSSLTFLSVIIPLIEEAIKPIGVWLLAGRNLTPKEGFTAGVISGAGYALFENLGNTSIGTDWTLIVIGRIGPTVLHIFTTGLIGYALALALKEKRYLRLGSAYLLSVVIHGLWNGLTTTSSIAGLDLENALLPSYWMPAGSIALILLAAGIFALLIRANRELRSTETDTQEMGLTKETIQPKEQNT
jgi:RsiW-degrading membrane proteinase PrsW (M82 family)